VALGFSPLFAAPIALADPTPDQAVAELSAWRTQLGEAPVSSTTVPAWNMGCQRHNNYEHLHNLIGHLENAGDPGYTSSGATAGPDSVLSEQGSAAPPSDASLLPQRVWDSAIFHRAALLEPRLSRIGFNSTTFLNGGTYTSWICAWVQNAASDTSPFVPPHAIDNGRTTPGLTLYPSPANGAVEVPTTFPAGTESPDPAKEKGVNGATLGWLMNVEINGPWAQSGGGGIVFAHGVKAILEPDGTSNSVPVVVSQCGPSGCGNGDPGGTTDGPYLGGGFGIFPLQPLSPNTTYRVALTAGAVTDLQAANTYPVPAGYSWCFSTGPTYTPSADCAAPATGAGPAHHEGAPTLSGTSLSIAHRRPKLTLSLNAGNNAPAIKTVAISLPRGLSFATKAKALRKGVTLDGSGAGRLLFTAKRGRGGLTLSVNRPARNLQLTIDGPAIQLSSALARKVKRHAVRALKLVVKVTDAAGIATTFRPTFTYH
jgi:hypothetical protein